jgi:hypothetical protein
MTTGNTCEEYPVMNENNTLPLDGPAATVFDARLRRHTEQTMNFVLLA